MAIMRTIGQRDLRDLQLFAGCKPSAMKKIGALGTRLSIRAGKTLMVAGARGSEVILVLHGAATCYLGTKDVAQFEAGDFFGEIGALDGRPRTATVVAHTDMEVLILDRHEFDQLIEAAPQIGHRILVSMAGRLRGANQLALADR